MNKFTRREQEIYDVAVTGISQQEMAEKLFIDVRTIKWHLTNIYKKLGLTGKRKYYRLLVLHYANEKQKGNKQEKH